VICAVTAAREPILTPATIPHGCHVNAAGSSIATTRELSGAAMAMGSLFVDRRESTVNESGDYLLALRENAIGPDHIRAEIGDVLLGRHPGRASDDEITIYKSLGVAVQDLAAAEVAVQHAREHGRGLEVAF
jgi:ornithine cyclodeaminase